MKATVDFDDAGMSKVEKAIEAIKSVIDIMTDGMAHAELVILHDSIQPYIDVIPDWDYIEWDEFESALAGE